MMPGPPDKATQALSSENFSLKCRVRELEERLAAYEALDAEAILKAVEERINTPEIQDFILAIKLEAEHQKKVWKKTDPEKTPADWYWLIGWLGGKAVMDPSEPGDDRTPLERKLHRIITVAAAAYNWHAWTKVYG